MIHTRDIKRLLIKQKSSSVIGTELENLDLDNYKGIRVEHYDRNGKLIGFEDTRDLRYEKLLALDQIRETALDDILNKVPLVEQMNMSAGNLSAEQAKEYADIIKARRALANVKKDQILAAKTFEELDKINIQEL